MYPRVEKSSSIKLFCRGNILSVWRGTPHVPDKIVWKRYDFWVLLVLLGCFCFQIMTGRRPNFVAHKNNARTTLKIVNAINTVSVHTFRVPHHTVKAIYSRSVFVHKTGPCFINGLPLPMFCFSSWGCWRFDSSTSSERHGEFTVYFLFRISSVCAKMTGPVLRSMAGNKPIWQQATTNWAGGASHNGRTSRLVRRCQQEACRRLRGAGAVGLHVMYRTYPFWYLITVPWLKYRRKGRQSKWRLQQQTAARINAAFLVVFFEIVDRTPMQGLCDTRSINHRTHLVCSTPTHTKVPKEYEATCKRDLYVIGSLSFRTRNKM